MRVLVDTGVFIAYLLKPHPDSFVTLLLSAVTDQRVTLLLCDGLLDEVARTIRRKPLLYDKIGEQRLQRLMALITAISEVVPATSHAIPPLTRDRTDNYLIFYAVIGRADYLVTVDKDLLALGQVQQVKVVHTADFRKVLAQAK